MHPVRVTGSGRLADHMYAVKSVSRLGKLKPDLVYSRSITASYYLTFLNRKFVFESHQDYLHSFRLEHRIQIQADPRKQKPASLCMHLGCFTQTL